MTKCIGCGVELQTTDKNKLGYKEESDTNLCKRCFRLSNYGEYQKVSLTNTDYKKIISKIPKNSLIVYTCDILSLNLDYIKNFSKVLLVITKRDIMPKSIKDEKIINYINKNTKVLNTILISSKKNYNLDNLYNQIKKYANNKDIYLVGNTNSGKSTLINKLQKNYGQVIDKNITISMYPSTTLSLIKINLNNLTIIDTPGLIDQNNLTNYLDKSDLKKLTPQKEIKPKTCQISKEGSIIIDNYLRLDYKTKTKNSLVIYVSNSLNIRFNSLKNNKLKNLKKHTFKLDNNQDIVIPGLGFIKFTKPIDIEIYTIKNVTPYLRDNLI